MHLEFDRWLLEARCHCGVSAPADGLPGGSGAVLVIQVDTAIPVSRAMGPPIHHRLIFSLTHSPALPISRGPAASAAATRKRAQLTERDTGLAETSVPGVSLPGWMSS